MAQDTPFPTKKTLNLDGRLLTLDVPKVIGILNLTPDSFYDGGKYKSTKDILNQTEKMLNEGASIIDIGGYSSRPQAKNIDEGEEVKRVTKGISLVKSHFPDAHVSVDTFRAGVAAKALDEGACMVNDISGGNLDDSMFDLIAHRKVPYILMHLRGTPQTMSNETKYENLLSNMMDYFNSKLKRLLKSGINDVIIDPGFGFAKTVDQNYEILNNLKYFNALKQPILAGISRKSMVYKKLGVSSDEALNGTTVLNTIALINGVSLLRVHDVKEAMETIKLFKATYN
jgi:dihydropteroate synthase